MSESYTLWLGIGTLSYDDVLKLDGRPLIDIIMKYRLPICTEVYDFGKVDIRIEFKDFCTCPSCNSIVRKAWIKEIEE